MRKGLIIIAGLIAAAAFVSSASAGPEALLPSSEETGGWARDGETLEYMPENLWEYINGQAESFLMYDFRSVAAQHYLSSEGLEIKVEIYEHASPLMAFGIYSQLRSPGSNYLDIGAEAFGDAYSINLWKDRYYIKVAAYEQGEKSRAAMEMFAGLVADRVKNDPGEPGEVSLFPPEGLEEKTVTYITGGVLGTSKFPPAFAADYRFDDDDGKLYLFGHETEEAASELFDWYVGEIGATTGESEKGCRKFPTARGEAPYRGSVLVFRSGKWVGIAVGFDPAGGNAAKLSSKTVELISAY
jgi:hypothetical protein